MGFWKPNSLLPGSGPSFGWSLLFSGVQMVFLTGARENGRLGSLVFSPQISLALFNLLLPGTPSPTAP